MSRDIDWSWKPDERVRAALKHKKSVLKRRKLTSRRQAMKLRKANEILDGLDKRLEHLLG